MQTRTIGQLAREAGVGVETVRYYERIGLIDRPERGFAGWRRYPESTLHRLQQIRQGRQFGFALREMIGLFGGLREGRASSCRALREAAQLRLAELDRGIARLQRRRKELAALLEHCAQPAEAADCAVIPRTG